MNRVSEIATRRKVLLQAIADHPGMSTLYIRHRPAVQFAYRDCGDGAISRDLRAMEKARRIRRGCRDSWRGFRWHATGSEVPQ